MKRRSLTVLLCLLAIISLASVGFASWVISAGDEEIATGNIQVEEVTDHRLTISNIKFNNVAYGSDSMPNFVFGRPAASDNISVENSWLNVSKVDERVMTIELTFDVAYKDKTTVVFDGEGKNADITVSWDETKTTWFTEATNKGYIAGKPELKVVETATGSFKVVISFEWGSLFDGKNPYEFYNAHESYETFTVDKTTGFATDEASGEPMSYGDHAAKYLSEMFEYFADVNDGKTTYKQFVLKISAQPVTSGK